MGGTGGDGATGTPAGIGADGGNGGNAGAGGNGWPGRLRGNTTSGASSGGTVAECALRVARRVRGTGVRA
ncbi:hypothetical protein ABLO15_06525 [Mycobacterium tuberculosis]